MIDREQISVMVKDVQRYLSDLSEMDIPKKEAFSNKETFYAVSMVVFAVMNRVIDIANELISGSEDIPVPGTYSESFELLLKNKMIRAETASDMAKLMRYRNIIAHEYYRLSSDELFRLKKDIYKAENFLQDIKKHLKG